MGKMTSVNVKQTKLEAYRGPFDSYPEGTQNVVLHFDGVDKEKNSLAKLTISIYFLADGHRFFVPLTPKISDRLFAFDENEMSLMNFAIKWISDNKKDFYPESHLAKIDEKE